jgi:agmatinase
VVTIPFVREGEIGAAATDYRPVDARVSPRFAGIRTFARLPFRRDELNDVDVAVLGFPFDTATSYRSGARFGPEGIRAVSTLLRAYNAHQRVDVFEQLACVDAGDVDVVPGDTPATYARVAEQLNRVVDAGAFPLVLGGDHSITLAELRALTRRHGRLALVHLDAHSDTWDSYFGQPYFHGTTFRRAVEEGLVEPEASVQAGLRGPLYSSDDIEETRQLGFTALTADELRALGAHGFGELVRDRTKSHPTFLSFDVDFCDPAYAPGTGTPEIGGFTSAEAQAFVRVLAGVPLVGCDVVETAPAYDGPGQPTALLAANIAWEMLALVALRQRVPDVRQPQGQPKTDGGNSR